MNAAQVLAEILALPPEEKLQIVGGTLRQLTAEDLKAIVDKEKAIYVAGIIKYRDVFGEPCETELRFMFTHRNIDLSSPDMEICEEGNKST